jgi:hypothetical protein
MTNLFAYISKEISGLSKVCIQALNTTDLLPVMKTYRRKCKGLDFRNPYESGIEL